MNRNIQVTFIVFAFNQEKYIREAILGAFMQTYSPLEIILSDDCSSDATFTIMQDMAATYEGQHNIVLNRNLENLGIARHLDKVYRLASGRLIINAPGDDISLPNRTSKLYGAWENNSMKPSLVFSNGETFNDDGGDNSLIVSCVVQGFCRRFDNPFDETMIIGCSSAIDKSIVENFDPIVVRFNGEDSLSFRRAHLLNGICYIPDILIKYRTDIKDGSGSISQIAIYSRDNFLKFKRMWYADMVTRLSVHRNDVLKLDPANRDYLLNVIDSQDLRARLMVSLLESKFYKSFYSLIFAVASHRNDKSLIKEFIKQFSIRWISLSFKYFKK